MYKITKSTGNAPRYTLSYVVMTSSRLLLYEKVALRIVFIMQTLFYIRSIGNTFRAYVGTVNVKKGTG